MFGGLGERLQKIFGNLSGKKSLTEENLSQITRELRLALLDADVHFGVASELIRRVKEKAVGQALLKSVKPGEQFTKLLHDELVALMGGEEVPLDLKGKLSTILLCGLQGAGKTTTAAKLASYIQRTEKEKKILLVAADLQRPAAIEQLKKLGSEIGVEVFSIEGEKDPLTLVKKGQEEAKRSGFDVMIVDTAGRLHLDEALMEELTAIKAIVSPREVLFVASAMTGQDAVKTAAAFDEKVGLTGTILTMLDGNARAGAALSIREVTKKPLRFEGVGEKIRDLQLFHPRSMADRILGMGDVINLVKKAEEHFDQKEADLLEEKMRKASFTYDDYLKQMGRVKKMGSIKSLLKMLPGMGEFGDFDMSDKEFGKIEAMILSMTPKERAEKDELTHERRRRIAKGSGVAIEEVNRLAKGFKKMKQLFKQMPDMKSKMKHFSSLSKMKGNNPWH